MRKKDEKIQKLAKKLKHQSHNMRKLIKNIKREPGRSPAEKRKLLRQQDHKLR